MANQKTILFIDDDNNLRPMFARRFVEAGFKVTAITHGGEEALAAIKKGEHDLLLLDLCLPLADESNTDNPKEGFRILEQIKDLPSAIKKIPVVVYSNLGESEQIKKTIALGAREHLVKAYLTPTELVEKIKNYLK